MKIKYEFVNETVEVEVDEEWATVIADLDRKDYNTDHKETRRHCSLEAYNLDDALLPSDEDIEQDFIRLEDKKMLHAALAELLPRQQRLIWQVFFENRTYADIAREDGVDSSAIRHAVERALKKIKKYL